MKLQLVVSVKELYDAQQHYFEVNYDRWMNDVLFTFNWWFLFAILIVPIFAWWIILDKTRIVEIAFVGLCISIMAIFLDVIGIVLSAWTYKYKLIQFILPLNPIDTSLLPVAYMLLYQWISKWKPFIIILFCSAAFGSFIVEPIFIWMDIYIHIWWKHIYSFPIYIAMGISVKALTSKMKSIQKQRKILDSKLKKRESMR